MAPGVELCFTLSPLSVGPHVGLFSGRARAGERDLSNMAAVLDAQLKAAVEAYRGIQAEQQKLVSTRAQLGSQVQENEMVLDELKRLDEDASVFKMIGPALIKQDLVEAKSNVGKRVEYIKGEIDRVEVQLKSLEGKSKDRENEVGPAGMRHAAPCHGP